MGTYYVFFEADGGHQLKLVIDAKTIEQAENIAIQEANSLSFRYEWIVEKIQGGRAITESGDCK